MIRGLMVGIMALYAGNASAESLKWEPANRAEKALVQEELDIEPSATVQAIRIDLNNDGKPETIIRIQGASFCGSSGCQVEIIQAGKRIGSFMGHDVQALDQVTKGYRSLKLDGRAVLTWNGRAYLLSK